MKKSICLLLILTLIFSSCTAYKHSVRVSKDEIMTLNDLEDLEPEDKVKVTTKRGLGGKGRLDSIDGSTLTILLKKEGKFTVETQELKQIKYKEDVVKTVANASSPFVILGLYIWLMGSFMEAAFGGT